jgi:serine/threonine protein kinase
MEGASLSYSSPEILERFKSPSEEPITDIEAFKKIDVFSFGAVMNEAINRDVPFKSVKEVDQLLKFIYEGKRPKISQKAKGWTESDSGFEILIDLMRDCWETEAKNRPKMEAIKKVLQKNSVN